MTLASVIFRQFGGCFGFLILQDKHIIRTFLLNIKLICTRCETGQESSPKAVFLPVSKVRINNFFIFRQCMYIVYFLNNNQSGLRNQLLFSIALKLNVFY
jgi:hypothetical protein